MDVPDSVADTISTPICLQYVMLVVGGMNSYTAVAIGRNVPLSVTFCETLIEALTINDRASSIEKTSFTHPT
jgi:hypothetical protein